MNSVGTKALERFSSIATGKGMFKTIFLAESVSQIRLFKYINKQNVCFMQRYS